MTSIASIEPITETGEWIQAGHYPSLEHGYDPGLVILAKGESSLFEL
jgi:hypothetical protein